MANQGPLNMEWAEPLPPACPPEEAKAPNGEQYYRLVETFPPTEHDFYSYRMLYPQRPFRLGECLARAVSIFTSQEECLKLKKLPHFKNKNDTVVALILPSDSGVVLQTGRDPSHFSWWRWRTFNPIPRCQKAGVE